MISPVELRRILGEWKVRAQRVKDILQPPTWNETEWRQFSQALALMVRDHGRSWIIDPNVYWDLRWRLQDGAELVCQIEHIPGEKTSLVVAQNGGFAQEVGSYTWLWAEFNMEGNFARDPYWVEGTWKEALTALLLPLDRQASYLLAGRAATPDSLLLQEGARPNDRNQLALLPGLSEANGHAVHDDVPEEKPPDEKVEIAREAKPAREESEAAPETVAVAAPTIPEVAPTELKIEEAPVANGNQAGEPFALRWGTAYRLRWKDTDDIAYALIEKFPQQDPTLLTLPEVQQHVAGLECFSDDPQKSTQSILEAIQMAWFEEIG